MDGQVAVNRPRLSPAATPRGPGVRATTSSGRPASAAATASKALSVSCNIVGGGWYRNQFWFLPRSHGDVLLCLGINGQMLYVDPATGTVAAKTSSWPTAQSPSV